MSQWLDERASAPLVAASVKATPSVTAVSWLGSETAMTGGSFATTLIESINPANGEVIASVRSTTAAQYDALISAAQESFSTWRMLPAPVREAAQALRDVLIGPGQPVLNVDDEQQEIGLGHRDADLDLDVLGQADLVDDADPTGVDQLAAAIRRLQDRRYPVARHSGRRIDDGDPRLDQGIEQGGLANVRAAHDGDDGEAAHQGRLRKRWV